MTCRKMASILGQVRANLTALPFLRAFTDALKIFVDRHKENSWDHRITIPAEVKQQVRELKPLLQENLGRPFLQKVSRNLCSDSSTEGWGGLDLQTGTLVQNFCRQNRTWHINLKELQAATDTVRSLAQPGDSVNLAVDNQVAVSYLKKQGGKVPALNKILRPLLLWCLQNRVQLSTRWVPTSEMPADSISRWDRDPGDYTLHPKIFQACSQFFAKWIKPTVDCFASPGNAQLPMFICRWPHHQALKTDSLSCSLLDLQDVYANPPWSVIGPWLHRLRDNPHLKCLLVCPLWVSAPWWPLLIKMRLPGTKCLAIPPCQGMFTSCLGTSMPGPRWHLACLVLSGGTWRAKRCKMPTLKFSCQIEKVFPDTIQRYRNCTFFCRTWVRTPF